MTLNRIPQDANCFVTPMSWPDGLQALNRGTDGQEGALDLKMFLLFPSGRFEPAQRDSEPGTTSRPDNFLLHS